MSLRRRSRKSSHFEVEVPIQVLNPDPPSPPPVPHGYRYVDPETTMVPTELTLQSRSANDRAASPVFFRSKFAPKMPPETRQLLREVDNIKRQQAAKNLREVYAAPLSGTAASKDQNKENTSESSTLRDLSSQLQSTLSGASKSEGSNCNRKRRRKIIEYAGKRGKRNSSYDGSFGGDGIKSAEVENKEVQTDTLLPQRKVHFYVKDSRRGRFLRRQENKRSSSADGSLVSEADRKTSNAPRRRTSSADERKKDAGIAAESRKALREKRQKEKPWRTNLAIRQEKHADPITKEEQQVTSGGSKDQDKRDSTVAERPWRQNMNKRKPIVNECESSVAAKSFPKTAAQKSVVQKYIREKRNQRLHEKEQREKEERERKDNIKKRLQQLEVERRKVNPQPQQPRKDVTHGMKQPSSFSDRKKRQEAFFRRKLAELSREAQLAAQSAVTIQTDHHHSPTPLLKQQQNKQKTPADQERLIGRDPPIPRGNLRLKELIAQHERDLEYVRRLTKANKESTGAIAAALTPADPFNFINSVRRKLGDDGINDGNTLLNKAEAQNFHAFAVVTKDEIDEPTSQYQHASSSAAASASSERPSMISEAPKSVSRAKGSCTQAKKSQDICGKKRSPSDVPHVMPEEKPSVDGELCVPSTLRLRFLAELNQMDAMMAVERHLSEINNFDHLSRAKVAQAAPTFQAIEETPRKPLRRSETRREFETRMRREFQELMTNQLMAMAKNKAERDKVAVDAATDMASIRLNKPTNQLSSSEGHSLRSLMAKTESNASEVMSAILKSEREAERSLLPKTISEAFEALTSSAKTISDDVPGETESTTTTIREEGISSSEGKTGSATRSLEDEEDKSSNLSLFSESENFGQFSSKLFAQNLEAESLRAKQQYGLLKQKEGLLLQQVKTELASLEEKKRLLRKDGGKHDKEVSSIKKKERAILLELKSRRGEIERLKKSIRLAEKERKMLMKQQRSLLKHTSTSTGVDRRSSSLQQVDNRATTVQGLAGVSKCDEQSAEQTEKSKEEESTVIEEDLKDSSGESSQRPLPADMPTATVPLQSPSKMESLKKTLGTTLKTPLSPKASSTTMRRRHSSADSDDSMSVSHSEEHSDVEIRVHALKEELSVRMRTAAKLKRQQRMRSQEKMRVQEVALKKQIEQYDKLIEQTREELEENDRAPVPVPPQIKTPKQLVARRLSVEDVTPPPSREDCDEEEAKEDHSSELNYSDDFTSSNASALSEVENKKVLPEAITESKKSDDQEKELFSKKSEEGKRNRLAELIAGDLAQEILTDACRQFRLIKQVRDSKAKDQKLLRPAPSSPSHLAPAITRTKPQDLMHTTFDISSESSEEEVKLATPVSPFSVFDDDAYDNPDKNHAGAEGNFIDDDFGLSSIRQESEQIRQQQLLIEQEIDRIQKEALVRPVPIKPPPPYTPPAKRPPPRPVEKFVPSTREDVSGALRPIVHAIYEAHQVGRNLESIDASVLAASISSPSHQESKKQFALFLCSLALELATEIYACERARQNPPWLPLRPLAKERLSVPTSEGGLQAQIEREALILLGMQKRSQKEKLVVRWSQKRRDRVDQILVRELHAEESGWTDYADDEAAVKDQVARDIFGVLLADTMSQLKSLHKQQMFKREYVLG